MAIPAMALLQQDDARQDIAIEPAARRRAAIKARGVFRTAGIRNWGCNRAVKTHRLVTLLVGFGKKVSSPLVPVLFQSQIVFLSKIWRNL